MAMWISLQKPEQRRNRANATCGSKLPISSRVDSRAKEGREGGGGGGGVQMHPLWLLVCNGHFLKTYDIITHMHHHYIGKVRVG